MIPGVLLVGEIHERLLLAQLRLRDLQLCPRGPIFQSYITWQWYRAILHIEHPSFCSMRYFCWDGRWLLFQLSSAEVQRVLVGSCSNIQLDRPLIVQVCGLQLRVIGT